MSTSRAPSPANTPSKAAKKVGGGASITKASGVSTPSRGTDQRHLDMSALNLVSDEDERSQEEAPKMTFATEKLLEEAKKKLEGATDKRGLSLVVIGEVEPLQLV